ncbi:hypothetical protein AVEN_86361-1 [Araneus ventricosus]|uniref:Uncharacterized protein n=1 Tax=Araneus ventricosus TaxID=182803 RepID=A0A4Y2V6W6_ARAVE|nr:hypothetical protein AVEN_175448-1 [Araneus ventricosus]GBO20340.1 hypothetical protein AVEN_86361-1 [Araneus ventricosus]
MNAKRKRKIKLATGDFFEAGREHFIKPAIHLYSLPFICPNTVFSTHSSRKVRHFHSSEVPKCAGSMGERSSLSVYSCSSIPHIPFPLRVFQICYPRSRLSI